MVMIRISQYMPREFTLCARFKVKNSWESFGESSLTQAPIRRNQDDKRYTCSVNSTPELPQSSRQTHRPVTNHCPRVHCPKILPVFAVL